MPSEVLGEIFSCTLPSLEDALAVGKFDMGRSPWLLTRICSHWRAISLSISSLWSRVAIDYSVEDANFSLSLVETQIHRTHKLDIHFYGQPAPDCRSQILIFQLLSRHSSRWEEFSLGMHPELLPFLDALYNRVPSLKRLWIQWEGPDLEGPTAVKSLDCFQTAPSLTDFGASHQYHFLPITLPVAHQLTRYQLTAPLEGHLAILKLAHNLVEAHIKVELDHEPWPDSEPIDLPRLRGLYSSHPWILNYLKAPALEELAFLVDREDMANNSLGHLEIFLGRLAGPLRRLCLQKANAHTIAQILGKFSFVTELVLMISDFDTQEQIDQLISALTFSGSTMLALQLHSLFFGSDDGTLNDFDYTTYYEMLKSRWRAEGSALKNAVLLVDYPGPGPEILRGFDALRQEGMDLLILEGSEATKEVFTWFRSSTWMF
ncbi:hypothetical protein K438DRAFT_1808618 [Mycena galopus ATCC 62051]|nr:hypothetical protein K438DRAFT_1808618 [Mycena galopus ATCC 62051]